jgi:2-phosphosulfolactate phosphatase
MNVQILRLIGGAKEAKGLTVIIDVFRAFTVEAYLARNNAKRIIPVGDIETAFAYRKQDPACILCGERGGKIIDGFDYGNSPSQVENVDFTGKTVIHTTSAGTQGIANAANADEIIAGSLVAAKAIADYIRYKNPEHVSLVCMGLSGTTETDEDNLAADYIKSLLEGEPLADLEERVYNLRFTDGAKFFDPAQQHVFPQRDYELSTQVNAIPFVLRMKQDEAGGPSYMERINIADLKK